jgi:hypothetical protein
MTTVVDQLVPDGLWRLVRPLPLPPRPPYGGRRRPIPDRDYFAAIGSYGPHLHLVAPVARQESDCGSPATAWRRLAQWATAGVFDALHLLVLDRLGEQGRPSSCRLARPPVRPKPNVLPLRSSRGPTVPDWEVTMRKILGSLTVLLLAALALAMLAGAANAATAIEYGLIM